MADNQEQPQGNESEKKKSTLESVISELGSFAKKALTVGAIAAMPFTYGFFDPGHIPRAAVATAGFTAGKATANVIQNKKPMDGLLWQGATGAMLSYPLAAGFTGLNNLERTVEASYGTAAAKAAKVSGMVFGLQPAVTTMRNGLNYGIGKKFRENLWPSLKNTFKYLSLIGAANVSFIYQYGLLAQMATSMLGSYVINLAESLRGEKGSIKNLYKAANPFPYIGAGASASFKLVRNTTKGFSEAIYAIGSSIGDLYKTKPVPSPPRPEAPEPAHA